MKVAQALAFASTASAVAHAYTFSENQAPAPAPNSVQSTGLTVNQESRIYGGSEANIDDYPFIASLRFELQDETFCGGTLIAPQYILTAGHCIKTEEDTIIAHLGTEFGTGSKTGEAIKVVEGYRHPMYNQKKHLYDVGLLKLEEASTQKTAKVCAADGSDNSVGTEATVLGWGMTEDGTKSNTLQEVNVAVISNAECNKQYNNRITEGMMCAGTGNNKDTCNGDSGGPLLVDDDILIGCVSWGSKCGQQAGIFTRLTYVMDYIEDILAGGDGSKFKGSSSGSMDGVILPPSSDSSSSDDLMSILQGSGSNDLSWLLDLLKSNSGSGSNDLSWLFDSNSDSDSASGSEDTKGGKATKAPIEESSESASEDTDILATKGKSTKAPVVEDDSDSGSDDLSWLLDSDSESGSEDSILVKGATKGKSTKAPVVEDDSDSGSDDLSWLLDSDSESGSEDPTLVKGATKGKSTKAASASHDLDWLFASESDSGSEDAVLVKGGKTSKKTKSSKTLVEEDSDSASEDSAIQSDSVHQSDQVTQQSFK